MLSRGVGIEFRDVRVSLQGVGIEFLKFGLSAPQEPSRTWKSQPKRHNSRTIVQLVT